MKCVLLRQVFGFTKSGRYHSVDRMLLDGPGGHLGDHTGADDRLGSAVRRPRERTGEPSAIAAAATGGSPRPTAGVRFHPRSRRGPSPLVGAAPPAPPNAPPLACFPPRERPARRR